jgi:hypothetical protein
VTTVIIPYGHAGMLVIGLPWWWPGALCTVVIMLCALGRNPGMKPLLCCARVLAILGGILVIALDALSRDWLSVAADLTVCAVTWALFFCWIRRYRQQVD